MRFATSFPSLNFYPPALQPWEPTASSRDLMRVAKAADSHGFDYISVSDHIVITPEMSELMGGHWCDSIAAMGVLAGATSNIIIYTSVLVAPYRQPLVLAKQLSTLDYLSGGRIVFGVGIGHHDKEFELLGVNRDDRAAMTDEYLEALNILWTEERPEYNGKFVQFDDIVFEPKPVQKNGMPVWVGGNSRPAIRRAARYGNGWVPWHKEKTQSIISISQKIRMKLLPARSVTV